MSFYANGDFANISLKTDFSGEQKPKNIIITHGRIVKECMKAKSLLEKENIDVGIILCEYISPYGEISDEIIRILDGNEPCNVFFVEEEIRSGGFGENLSAAMRQKTSSCSVAYHIIAADDAFVKQTSEKTYAEAAGVDFASIANAIRKININ